MGIRKIINMNQKASYSFTIDFEFLVVLVFLITGIVMGCDKNRNDPEERPKDDDKAQDSLKILPDDSEAYLITVNPSSKFQTIDNFSASDGWAVQFVGKWPSSKTEKMADWLFSLDTTNNGQPIGIGLSAWRFNIGAGSAEQGNQSDITDEWRRSQCFLQSNGTYNWNKHNGQQWFLKAAKERGVEQFIGFSNSPPVNFTKNGKAHGNPGDPQNISDEKLSDFAEFLVEVSKGIKAKTGIELTWLSPVNEPQWDWTANSQEGCHYENEKYLQLVEVLDQKLTQSGDINSEILVTEAAKWSYLYGLGNTLGNQIGMFFGPDSPVKDAPNLARIIAGHSYHTTTPESTLINIRESVWTNASLIDNLKVWSTEYCPLGEGDLQHLGWSNWYKDLSMHVALYVARIIHHDLVYANVSAWQWWLAISPYNYPDGLIYVSKDKINGTYSDSRLLWALGNFSRFVRPGANRIQTECSNEELFITAFEHGNDKSCAVIVINYSEKAQPVKFNLENIGSSYVRPYITSDKDIHKLLPMKTVKVIDAFELPARSIITFTCNML